MAFFTTSCFSLRKNRLLNRNESATTCPSLPINLEPTPLAMGVVSQNLTAINFASAISPHEDIPQAKATDKKEIIPTEKEHAPSSLQFDFLSRLIETIKVKREFQDPSSPPVSVGTLLIEPIGSAKQEVESDNETQVARPANFLILVPILKVPRIKNIRCEGEHYHYYGITSPEVIVAEATKFISDNSSVFQWSVKKTLAKFLAITIQDSKNDCQVNPEALWLVVRMTQKSEEFVIPRWHRDGRMIECTNANHALHCRYATTLLGPTTLVLQETEVVTQGMKQHVGKRKETANALAGEIPLEITRGQIIRFSWGQEDSPVHSEPDLVAERVFISCIYGSISEIKDIAATRRQKIGDLQAQFRNE
ncbi:uncharacterized protein EAE97_001601 [Botrytis byssoidea]|uniref:Uncharacterized protein n=1 Tax=Botrytis byssoidea TaxID=139641 RepID=A0A9P5IYK9_9HELO|nr:uncharacterized protein EAE97_001601 [Botrytis byssoidea]KAF7952104.1 hypothetical protein EAE97_001601 [Botrytis byssoidea]